MQKSKPLDKCDTLVEDEAIKETLPSTDHDSPTRNDFEDFIYLISHDVRSSVRALLELPQWIAEDLEEAGFKVGGSVEASIALMNKHTGRLDRMLVDLLAYSRIGRMQERENVSLQAALTTVLEEGSLPAGFELLSDLDHDNIEIGERDILTLIDCLLSNSVKHHDRAEGRISIVSKEIGGRVHISISDDGPGIEEEFHTRVFGAMTTLRPRDEVEGSGMGLAIVAKIVELNKGTVQIGQSPFGRGTCVVIDLPMPQTACTP